MVTWKTIILSGGLYAWAISMARCGRYIALWSPFPLFLLCTYWIADYQILEPLTQMRITMYKYQTSGPSHASK